MWWLVKVPDRNRLGFHHGQNWSAEFRRHLLLRLFGIGVIGSSLLLSLSLLLGFFFFFVCGFNFFGIGVIRTLSSSLLLSLSLLLLSPTSIALVRLRPGRRRAASTTTGGCLRFKLAAGDTLAAGFAVIATAAGFAPPVDTAGFF